MVDRAATKTIGRYCKFQTVARADDFAARFDVRNGLSRRFALMPIFANPDSRNLTACAYLTTTTEKKAGSGSNRREHCTRSPNYRQTSSAADEFYGQPYRDAVGNCERFRTFGRQVFAFTKFQTKRRIKAVFDSSSTISYESYTALGALVFCQKYLLRSDCTIMISLLLDT